MPTFNRLPEGLDEDAFDLLRRTVRETPGYVAGFHLRDTESGKALSVSVYDDMNAIRRTQQALAARPDDRRVGIEPDQVEFFEAIPF